MPFEAATAADNLGIGPTMRADWRLERDAILGRVQNARADLLSATTLLAAARAAPRRAGDNEAPFDEAALDGVSIIIRSIWSSLGVLEGQLATASPDPAIVRQAEQTLSLVQWAWRQFAGGVLKAAGGAAFTYLCDHHAELVEKLRLLIQHVDHLTPVVETLVT
jgi:hypothetical protein